MKAARAVSLNYMFGVKYMKLKIAFLQLLPELNIEDMLRMYRKREMGGLKNRRPKLYGLISG